MSEPVARELLDAFAAADEAIERLEHAALSAASVANRDQVELEDYASTVARVMDYQSTLKLVLKELNKALGMRVSNHGTIGTNDGLTLERKDAASRKSWQHPRLKAVVAEKVIERHTDEDGAIDAPISVLIREALDTVSISAWKVTQLREYGLNPDSYCTKSDGTVKFSVVNLDPTKSEDGDTDDDDFA